MQLYNTQSGRKEPFTADGDVTIYVCGVTPYDTTHIGHAFTYMSFDALIRYLEHRGHRVRYVQNVTDIDDDVLRKAKELGVAWDELGREQTRRFLEDMAALNVRPPDVYPKATEETRKMIEIVEALLARGYAYRSDGNVYYHVANDPEFGELSGLAREAMLPIANERGNDPTDPHKRDPLDFVLWQAAKPGEPTWPSPWGPGRPGWHIECSAMSLRYLGPTIDIHGGGADLIFPHHECEIVQSERYTGRRPFVRYWLHTGMVRLDGVKMSKSLGNLIMVRTELEQHHPDAIRLYLLGHHYRGGWDWRHEEMRAADTFAARLAKAAGRPPSPAGDRSAAEGCRRRFYAALDDDLDTPAAVSVLGNLATAICNAAPGDPIAESVQTLRDLGAVLGLRLA